MNLWYIFYTDAQMELLLFRVRKNCVEEILENEKKKVNSTIRWNKKKKYEFRLNVYLNFRLKTCPLILKAVFITHFHHTLTGLYEELLFKAVNK